MRREEFQVSAWVSITRLRDRNIFLKAGSLGHSAGRRTGWSVQLWRRAFIYALLSLPLADWLNLKTVACLLITGRKMRCAFKTAGRPAWQRDLAAGAAGGSTQRFKENWRNNNVIKAERQPVICRTSINTWKISRIMDLSYIKTTEGLIEMGHIVSHLVPESRMFHHRFCLDYFSGFGWDFWHLFSMLLDSFWGFLTFKSFYENIFLQFFITLYCDHLGFKF